MKSREKTTNVGKSIRKFFIDHVYTTNNVELSFNKNIAIPFLGNKSVDRWVSVLVGAVDFDILDRCEVTVFPCVREGTDLEVLTDLVLGGIIDDDGKVGYITLYDSNGVNIGAMPIFFGGNILINQKLDDQTEFSRIPLYVKWAG